MLNGSAILAYLQYQALFLWLVLAAGWAWAGANRRAERLQRLVPDTSRPTAATTLEAAAAKDTSANADSSTVISQNPGSCKGGPLRAEGDALGAGCRTGTAVVACTAAAGRTVVRQPAVSVVMPVKGCRAHSIDNWRSHVGVQYDGPVEFVFVVESEADPAVPILEQLLREQGALDLQQQHGGTKDEQQGQQQRHAHSQQQGRLRQKDEEGAGPGRLRGRPAAASAAGAAGACGVHEQASGTCGGGCGPRRAQQWGGGDRVVRVEVAGLATTCSQKAHNLVHGIRACSPAAAYVLCLDDDVALHPGSLAEMVAGMERERDVWMTTGYPFDVPPPGSGLPAYLALVYHLPLLIAFSVAARTHFVWGGCMMMRGPDLREDTHGLLAAWRNGGYSDDLIAASRATELGLPILVPRFAIFPQRLDPRMGWRAWLNYLHRQLFVLDTYTNRHNRATNHTMMALHSGLSWLLVLPSLAAFGSTIKAMLRLLAAALPPTVARLHGHAEGSGPLSETLYGSVAVGTSGGGSPGQPGVTHGSATAATAAAAAAAAVKGLLDLLPGSVWAVLVGWAAAHAALVFMTAEVLALFRVLSPASPPIPLRAYSWWRLWAALLGSNALLPLLMAYTYLCPHVEWGGVTYRKHRGLVTPVRRREA